MTVDMTKPIGEMGESEFSEMTEAIKNAKYSKEVLPEKGMFAVFLIMIVQEKEFSRKRLSPLFKTFQSAESWKEVHDKRVSKAKIKRGKKNA